jgi:hypothetical protein
MGAGEETPFILSGQVPTETTRQTTIETLMGAGEETPFSLPGKFL